MHAIKELRERAGFTQAEVAEAVGVTQSTVSQWEGGKTYPNIAKLRKLAAVLGCSVDDLLSGETEATA